MKSLPRLALPAVAAIALAFIVTAGAAQPTVPKYESLYTVQFTYPVEDLLHDLRHTPRGDVREESSIPFHEWNSHRVKERYGHWGPPARHYPAPAGVAGRPVEWQRERIIALGLRYQGYGYQHHHIPDWQPPSDWPWDKTAVGHNGKGVDCSNFTAFVYNQGLGLKPSSAIKKQAEQREIPGPEGQHHRAERIDLPGSYEGLVKTLKTGDLLFVRNRSGELAHVVLWVGPIGRGPDNRPLILDSHGDGVKDARGETIPAGIHLRPFRENSWYFKSASHAHRYLHE
jgi:hypothetical protein